MNIYIYLFRLDSPVVTVSTLYEFFDLLGTSIGTKGSTFLRLGDFLSVSCLLTLIDLAWLTFLSIMIGVCRMRDYRVYFALGDLAL